MKKRTSLLMKVGVTIAILFFLFFKIGLGNITNAVSQTTPLQIVIAILYLVALIILSVLNFSLLLRIINKRLKFSTLLPCYLHSWSIGFFSPGKIGELSIAYFLKKKGVSLGEGSATFIAEKIVSVAALILMAFLGIFVFDAVYSIKGILFAVIALTFLIIILLSENSRRFIRRYVLRKYAASFTGFYKTLSCLLSNKLLIASLFLTLSKFIIGSFGVKMIFQLYSIDVSLFAIIAVIGITTLSAFIPVSISGLGVRESVAVFLYKQIGIAPAYALTTSFLFTVAAYITAALVLIFRLTKPDISKIQIKHN